MISILQTSIVSTEEVIAHADSVKVMLAAAADNLVHDPDVFFQNLVQDFVSMGLKIIAALLIYMVGAWMIRRVRSGLQKLFNKKKTDKTLSSFVLSLTTISLSVILIIIAVGTLGVNTTSLAALLAAGGMALGMAMSGTVQNFAGGIMILLFKPFKGGDLIKTSTFEGYVQEVTIAHTKILTYNNSYLIVPNGNLINGNIDNFSHLPHHRIAWTVNVEYGSDSKLVKEELMRIITADPCVITDGRDNIPAPVVLLSALQDNSVEFTLRAWVENENYWPVFYRINEAIYNELPKKGIGFPFPQLDVRIKGN